MTSAIFQNFWHPLPPYRQFFSNICRQFLPIFDPYPPPNCRRRLWTAPKIIPKLLGNIFISVWVYLMYRILNLNQSSMTIISFYLCMTCYNWTWKLEWKQVILMATLLGRFAGFAHSGRELGELKLRPFLYRKILTIQFTSPIHRYFFFS